MLTKTKRRILFYVSMLIFAAAVVPILLYSLGYRISSDFKVVKTGGIFIRASEAGADVFAGSKHKRTSLLGKSGLIKNLAPGTYKVAVRKDGFWDWEKSLDVVSEIVASREALLVPKNPDGKILGTTTPRSSTSEVESPKTSEVFPRGVFQGSVKKFWAIPKTDDFVILGEDGKFYTTKDLPAGKAGPFDIYGLWGTTTAEILKSKKESVFDETFSRIIYWDKSSINSYWFEDLKKIPEWEKQRATEFFTANSAVRAVASYPGWPDWLIVAMSNGVWAMEMDSSGGQNIFPIYQGKQPKIMLIESEKIIIFDDGRYLEIVLPS